MRKNWFILSFSTVLILLLGGIPQIFAQETKAEEFTLEEITVTAQKRAENQQKVAIPMDVITGDQLAETGKTNVDDILSNLTGVQIGYAQDGMRVQVRGLAEADTNFNNLHVSSPIVAVNVDGAFNSSSSAGQNLFDVERVEVLYGPQSTMYASNSPGGIVNVVTAAPRPDKYAASASLEVGNYSLFNGQAMVNAPIVKDRLAMRLAVQKEKRDPYVSGSNQTGENTDSARLKTLWQPTDEFSATVTLNYTKRINGGMMGGQVEMFDTPNGHWYTSGAGPGASPVMDGKVTDPWTAAPTAGAGPGPAQAPNSATQYTKGITGDIKWETGIGSLSIVPQYSRTTSNDQAQQNQTDIFGNITSTYMVYNAMRGYQKGVEARMSSKEDFLFKWILGVNYYKSKSSSYVTYSNGNTPGNMWVTDDTKAVFGNITYPFTDKFRGDVGMRWSYDKAQSKGGMFDMSNAPAYKSPDYKVGIEYDLAANSMLYADYATSYRVSAFRTGIPPEKDKTYTIGVKNRFLDNKLQLNASAYLYNYKNVQVQLPGLSTTTPIPVTAVVDPDGNPPTAAQTSPSGNLQNVGAAGGPPGYADPYEQFQRGAFRTIGVDASADWIITSKDKMNLAFTYLNAKWVDCTSFAYWQSASGGHFWPGDGVDYSGSKKAYSPTLTTNLGYEHNFDLWEYGTLIPHVDIMYKTHYVLDFGTSSLPVSYQEAYYNVNGNVTFTHASGIWSLNAYIKNATNYAAKNLYFMGNLSISDPRTYGAVLTVKF
jgi:iron complex outermembrane recepter protein